MLNTPTEFIPKTAIQGDFSSPSSKNPEQLDFLDQKIFDFLGLRKLYNKNQRFLSKLFVFLQQKLYKQNFNFLLVEIKVLNSSKEEIEVEIDSLTISEILRVYLNKDPNVTLAVWKRDHPTKNPVLLVKAKGKTAKKAINDAVRSITKELNSIESDFSKIK